MEGERRRAREAEGLRRRGAGGGAKLRFGGSSRAQRCGLCGEILGLDWRSGSAEHGSSVAEEGIGEEGEKEVGEEKFSCGGDGF